MEIKEPLTAFEGLDLTEEVKHNLSVLFEASVAEKVEALKESIETEFRQELDENVDKYTTYAAQSYLEENAVALETGFKVELAEKIITKFKDLMEEIGVSVPEDQQTDFEKLQEKYDGVLVTLEEKNSLIESLGNKVALMEIEKTIETVSEGMVVSEKETFVKLIENIAYTSEDQYSKDISLIKERFFVKAPVITESLEESVKIKDKVEKVVLTKGAAYANALKNTTK
jgi:hypothetical protein